MTYIDPSLKEVYQTLLNNDYIIDYLKKEKVLISKEDLKQDYSEKDIEDLSQAILVNNSNILYDISKVLLKYKDQIKSNNIRILLDEKVAWQELSEATSMQGNFNSDIYINLIYTYKYCSVSSFFQNNKKLFIPDFDYTMLENNSSAMAFYDAMLKEYDKLDNFLEICSEYNNIDHIPWDLLNYFSQLLGFEKNSFGFTEEDIKKYKLLKEITRDILDIYRLKGTNYSFELFFRLLGYNIEIKEYFFDRRLFYISSSSNEYTGENDKEKFSFYLTTRNPLENDIKNLSIRETVSLSDLSEQYSLFEFEDLIKEYGIETVLGYKKYYFKDGSYRKYNGKIYKYFKTNYIFYDISSKESVLTGQESEIINRCLDFFTPSFIVRKPISNKSSLSGGDDIISFDGDGTKEYNPGKGFGKFEFLDSEDWSQHLEDKLKGDNYKNSIYDIDKEEGEKFRFPILNKAYNISLNKYYRAPARYIKKYNVVKYFWEKDDTGRYIPNFSENNNKEAVNFKEAINETDINNQIRDNRDRIKEYYDPKKLYDYSLTGKGPDGRKSIKEILKEKNLIIKVNSGQSINKGDSLKFNTFYYNTKDGELYLGNIENKASVANNFFGRFEYSEAEGGKIYLYDEFWKGYDEESDKDDYIMYNHQHISEWKEMDIDEGTVIRRPIRSQTNNLLTLEKRNQLIDYLCSVTFSNFLSIEQYVKDEAIEYIEINKKIIPNISPKDFKLYEKNGQESYVISNDLKFDDNKKYYIIRCGILNNIINNSKIPGINKIDEFFKKYDNFNSDHRITMLYNIYLIDNLLSKKGNYYINDYGEYYDPYSEAFDISKTFFNGDKDFFLEEYYYKKILSLYRSRYFIDKGLNTSVIDKNPIYLTRRVLNKYINNDKHIFKNNLLSSYKYDDKGNKVSVKLKITKMFKESKKNNIFIYTKNKYIIDTFGYDFSSKNKEEKKELAIAKLVGPKSICNSAPKIVTNGSIYKNEDEEVVMEFKVHDNKIIENIVNLNNLDKTEYIYLELNNFTNHYSDNHVSYPNSDKEYLKSDIYGRVDEFCSFGDDREIRYKLINKSVVTKKTYSYSAFINKENRIVISVPKSDIKSSNINSIKIEIKDDKLS